MRAIEKRVKRYDKILTYVGCDLFDNYYIFRFKDSAGDEWIHYQIFVEDCESKDAAFKAKAFITKSSKLKVGNKAICKCAIRQELNGGVYRNVEEVVKIL